VKQLVLLQQKSSERRKTGLFVVEGQREIAHCAEVGYQIDSLYCCPELCMHHGDGLHDGGLLPHQKSVPMIQVTAAVYEKIAYRGSTEGLLAVVHGKTHTLDSLQLPADPIIVVLESVEKPGNLGAVLRTADAAHADAVIVCDPLTDLYNPNLIRSSIGAIFTVPCVACTSETCIAFLKARGIQILTAQLQDSRLYYDTDMRKGTAIVMGTESTGLTDVWRQAADAHIRIPMLGRLDSLNVSVSAAILLFEAVRQRNEVKQE
jgi:TrmH family RNA methyltransferase